MQFLRHKGEQRLVWRSLSSGVPTGQADHVDLEPQERCHEDEDERPQESSSNRSDRPQKRRSYNKFEDNWLSQK